MSIFSRVKDVWNAFTSRSPTNKPYKYSGLSVNGYRPDYGSITFGKTSIINSIHNRIAVDSANIGLRHVIVDENGDYTEDVKDGLNECLSISANIDQTGFSFLVDAVVSMLEEGNICLFPVDALHNESAGATGQIQNEFVDILSVRKAKIKEWMPNDVRIEAYNEAEGRFEELVFPKKEVCLIENPFFLAMNAQDSTAQRLAKKMRLLDDIDNKNGSDRLDLIIQVPYSARTPSRQAMQSTRMADIEQQLTNSKYGIAYLEATEKVIQLNRPVENRIQEQIEYLTNLLFSQLGLTGEIMNGTASPEAMQNYYSRTISPILKVFAYEMTRKWLSRNAYTRGHRIWFYQNAFELVPVSQMSEIVDKFSRNEIMTGNEIRRKLGMKPSEDPRADELRNKNLSQSAEEEASYDNIKKKEEETDA